MQVHSDSDTRFLGGFELPLRAPLDATAPHILGRNVLKLKEEVRKLCRFVLVARTDPACAVLQRCFLITWDCGEGKDFPSGRWEAEVILYG